MQHVYDALYAAESCSEEHMDEDNDTRTFTNIRVSLVNRHIAKALQKGFLGEAWNIAFNEGDCVSAETAVTLIHKLYESGWNYSILLLLERIHLPRDNLRTLKNKFRGGECRLVRAKIRELMERSSQ